MNSQQPSGNADRLNRADNQSATKFKLWRIVKTALTIMILASIFGAVLKLTGESNVADRLLTLEFFIAAVLAVVYRVINPLGWGAVLRGLGYRINAWAAINVWLAAESRRWLPGGIWGYTSRAVQAKRLGVPVGVASASMLVELIITMAAALLVSLIGLLLYFDQLRDAVAGLIADNGIRWQAMLLLAALGIALIAISYMFRGKLISKLNLLNEKWQLLHSVDLSCRKLSTALAYFVVMACLNGAVNLAMLNACTDASVPVIAMIAATSAAWVFGYLAFFSPGGLFVREAVLATLLLPWIPYETALAIAILSRLAQLFAELLCMLLPAFTMRTTASAQNKTPSAPLPVTF